MPPPLSFAVRRREPVLVGPAAPTPRETKRLSDIDDQETLRGHVPFVFLYRGGDDGRDPAAVIRRAIAEALVPYYPLAGRLREVEEETRKLVVDCTGELGVTFVEADADVRLADLEAAAGSPAGGGLRPPFPCMDQLLFVDDNIAGDCEDCSSGGVLGCPLLLVQVTRLLCGGFVLAVRLNHTICDATGLAQFMAAVADLAVPTAAAAAVTTTTPTWSRELLEARNPPRPPSFPHREYDDDALPQPAPPPLPPADDMVTKTFTFDAADISAIKRRQLGDTAAAVTTYEAVTAALWRARTAALEVPAADEVRLVSIVGFRRSLPELGLPGGGYYGNACVPVAALTTAAALLEDGGAMAVVELVRGTRTAVTAEYVRSTVDLLALRRRPAVSMRDHMFAVSDNRHAGFDGVDFGWGPPVYGGPAAAMFGVSFFVNVGEDKVGVIVVLPRTAMDRFASEVETLVKSD